MKHITEQYGQTANQICCTEEEFTILCKFLEKEGVQLRKITSGGNVCTCQIQNLWGSATCLAFSQNSAEREKIVKKIELAKWND